MATSPAPSSSKAVFTSADDYLSHRFMEEDASIQAVADERVPEKDIIYHRLQRDVLNIQAQLDHQQAREQICFYTIQGEISCLSKAAARLASSVGRKNNPNTQTTPEQNISQQSGILQIPHHLPHPAYPPSSEDVYTSDASTDRLDSKPQSNHTYSSNIPAAAYVDLQVFGEMPAQNSWQETHGTAPDYCSGHHNLIHSSCVNNLSEQNLDGRPHQYGFHNLNRQSVFLSDGTARSYFALPENYLLERATEPVFDVYGDETEDCSDAIVDVSVSTLEQQSYAEDQRAAEQTSKYMRKAFENETHSSYSTVSTTATGLLQFQAFERLPVFDVDDDKMDDCSSVFVDVFASTPEQQIYEEDKQESEKLAKFFHKASKNVFSEQLLRSYNKAPETEQTNADVLDYTFEQQQQSDKKASANGQQLRDLQLNELVIHERRKEWNPGVLVMHSGFTSSRTWNTRDDQWLKFSCPTSCELPLSSSVKGRTFQVTQCLGKMKFTSERPTVGSFSDHAAKSTSTHVPFLCVNGSIECYKINNKTKLNSLPDFELGGTMEEAQQFATSMWMKLSTEAGQQEWDPGIGTPSSMDRWLYWHQDIKLTEIALWLITFNPP